MPAVDGLANNTKIQVRDVDPDDLARGAGLFAKQDFRPGDVVCVFEGRKIEALDTARLSDTCYYCYTQPSEVTNIQVGIANGQNEFVRESNTLQVCTGCRVVRYCNRKCQKSSWQGSHKQECKFFAAVYPRIAPNHMRALFREIVSRPTATSFDDFDKFDKCSSHVTEFLSRKDDELIKLVQMTQATREYTKTRLSFDDVLKMYCILKINSITLMTETFDPLGLCFQPTIAKINHSCEPNMYVRFAWHKDQGTRSSIIEVTPLRKIRANEELTISYIEQNQTFEARQQELRDRYFFTCTCSKCIQQRDQLSSQSGGEITGLNSNENIHLALPTKLSALQQRITTLIEQSDTDNNANPSSKVQRLQTAMQLLTTHNWPRDLYPYPQTLQKLTVSLIDAGQFRQAILHAMIQHFDVDPLVYHEIAFHPIRLMHLYTLVRLIGAVIDGHDNDNDNTENTGAIDESGSLKEKSNISKLISQIDLEWWHARLAGQLVRDASVTYNSNNNDATVGPSFRHIDGLFGQEVKYAEQVYSAQGVESIRNDSEEVCGVKFASCRKVMDLVYRSWKR